MKSDWIYLCKIFFIIIFLGFGNTNVLCEVTDDEKFTLTPIVVTKNTKTHVCLECHGIKGFAIPTDEHGTSEKRKLFINPNMFSQSVHSQQGCMSCHSNILKIPHGKVIEKAANCIHCHEKSLEILSVENIKNNPKNELTKIIEHGNDYLTSIHAESNHHNPNQPNANCWNCHGKHDVLPKTNIHSSIYRLNIPETCGQCHKEKFNEYVTSAHGVASIRYGKKEAAICSDCHTSHKIEKTHLASTELKLVENCGGCHKEEYQSYFETYHGQVERLGYTYTAKCFDCHNPHKVQSASNPESQTHIKNRVQTCKKCHKNATNGFATFEPHSNTHDFKRFPIIWIVAKAMNILLISVFLFFWTHSILWFYRENKERKIEKNHVTDHNGQSVKNQYVRRFSWQWRLAHLLLAISVMGLVLTGITSLYANTIWAHLVIKFIGGPNIAAIIHRVCACTFAALFFGHIIYILNKLILKNTTPFKWFGPNSLLPRWQDFYDCINMFKWFFGKGSRPTFDRFTYWEKFDYWAPFWGMNIIGFSGLIMWFPTFFANFLPGWIFNVAIIIHADEAFLAAVFLFTVHFFNCHFRPNKFPQDISMFTGVVSLEEYIEEHTVEYQRLVKNNKLNEYLIDAPSVQMTKYSKVLGITLIIIGMTLLLLIIDGFVRNF